MLLLKAQCSRVGNSLEEVRMWVCAGVCQTQTCKHTNTPTMCGNVQQLKLLQKTCMPFSYLIQKFRLMHQLIGMRCKHVRRNFLPPLSSVFPVWSKCSSSIFPSSHFSIWDQAGAKQELIFSSFLFCSVSSSKVFMQRCCVQSEWEMNPAPSKSEWAFYQHCFACLPK